MEDQKIRQYKIEDREQLRQVNNLDVWEQGYLQYKNDVGMPALKSPLEELSWLLSYAVRLEFLDDPDAYKEINSQDYGKQQAKSMAPSIKAQNQYDNMDCKQIIYYLFAILLNIF